MSTNRKKKDTSLDVMSAAEAARLLGCHRKTIYAAVRHGSIPARRLGKKIVVSRAALADWLACR